MEPDQVPSFFKLKQHQRKILQCAAVSSIFSLLYLRVLISNMIPIVFSTTQPHQMVALMKRQAY